MKKYLALFLILLFLPIMLGGCRKTGEGNTTEPIENNDGVLTESVQHSEGDSEASSSGTEISDSMHTHEDLTNAAASQMLVKFLDVGQGAATLIVCDGEAMLLDGGREETATAVQLALIREGVTCIKYIIATHPDSDHIGGLDAIAYKFPCEYVLMPDKENDTYSYENLIRVLQDKTINPTIPEAGDIFTLGTASFKILGPTKNYSSTNDNSLVLRLQHGDNSFLFTGDAEKEAERDVYISGENLNSDVYLAGHHGSKTSSSEEFLQAISPEYTIISCGKDNAEGHPHEQTLARLEEIGTTIYRTDICGDISVVSDGSSLTWQFGTASEELGQPGYVGNIRNQKLHLADCEGLPEAHNRLLIQSLEEAEKLGFTKEGQCKRCLPYGR